MEQRSEISLSPNSWHAKLIGWVFGFQPSDFRNLCPYFWLLVASMILFFIVTPFKLVGKLFVKIVDTLDDLLSKRVDKAFDRFIENLEKGEVYSLLGDTDSKINQSPGFYRKSELVRKNLQIKLLRVTRGKDWMSKLRDEVTQKYKGDNQWKYWSKYLDDEANSIELKMAAAEKRRQKIQVKAISRKETIAEITEITKSSVKGFGSIGVMFAAYGVSFILTDILTFALTRSFGDYMVLLKVLGGTAGVFILIVYGVWCEDEIKEWFKYRSSKTWFEWAFLVPVLPLAGVVWVLKVVFFDFLCEFILKGIFEGLLQGAVEYGGIFTEYFNASYSDYCPGIKWEKEDKK